jgi:hypothetical protein
MINFPKIDEFSFKEAFNNNSGKTDMSLICAFLMIVTACLGFGWALIAKYEIAINLSVTFATLGAGLLGIRRFTQEGKLTLLGGNDKATPPTEPEKTIENANN